VHASLNDACALVEGALVGPFRRRIVDAAAAAGDARAALLRLRDSMQSHAWKGDGIEISLGRFVKTFDARTREDGFHVLNDWDGKADRVSETTIPVDVLDYFVRLRGAGPPDRDALAVLVDYYFAHLLALFALRSWDEGDADENLDRVDRLLAALQGADGSGQRFAANAETLLLIGTSHFEAVEIGYDKLLARVRSLDGAHRKNVALGHAASMGSHLRFGFEATYHRDTVAMRRDNVADYPWLSFSLATLMRDYAQSRSAAADAADREAVVEALLNGLSADARAFVGEAPASLASCAAERDEFAALFRAHRAELVEAFTRHEPSAAAYSPLSFFFNFSHNVVKGIVVDALLRGRPWPIGLNDLLSVGPRGAADTRARQTLAGTLMGYARSNPDTIGGRAMPVIVYDPQAGRQAFSIAMHKISE
jgi:hypothetical protein